MWIDETPKRPIRDRLPHIPAGWVLFAVAIVLVALCLPLISTSTDLHQLRDQCHNNMLQIGTALHVYEERHHILPPGYVADARGRPLYSWRALLLPYIESEDLARLVHADEAWDGPHNKQISARSVYSSFHCPCDRAEPPQVTDYLAVVGPNTAWPGATGRKLSEIKNPERTILLIESADTGINWLEPRDVKIGEFVPGVNRRGCFGGHGICSHHSEGGAHVLFADGHVEFLPNDTDPQKILSMLDVRNP
jgi:prepilin-type processing-associated H-X9-DG protein